MLDLVNTLVALSLLGSTTVDDLRLDSAGPVFAPGIRGNFGPRAGAVKGRLFVGDGGGDKSARGKGGPEEFVRTSDDEGGENGGFCNWG